MIRYGAHIGFVVSGLLHIAAIAAVVIPSHDARSQASAEQRIELNLAMFEPPAATVAPTPPADSEPVATHTAPPPVQPLAPKPEPEPEPERQTKPEPPPTAKPEPQPHRTPAASKALAPEIQPHKASPAVSAKTPPAPRSKPARAATPQPKRTAPKRESPATQPAAAAAMRPQHQAAPTSSAAKTESRAPATPKRAGRQVNTKQVADRYLASLVSAIQRHRFYPSASRRLKEEGTVVVRFVVQRSGAFSSVAVSKSSGSARLDSAAVEAVKKTAPFKPIPSELSKSQWPLTVPIVYRLRR